MSKNQSDITVPTHFRAGAKSSLSAYFPRGTQYFYAYPTGEDSNFLNKVPPATDELVAARALSCAGPEVSVVSFTSTAPPQVESDLLDSLALPAIDQDHLTLLPKSIDVTLHGKARNEAVMAALAKSVMPGSLVMAQPFNDEKVAALYEISPDITIWLNDKANMVEYIRPDMMPARLAEYASGADFAADTGLLARDDMLPCVVKVSSSSSGDGVYICHALDDIEKAQAEVKSIAVNVLIERFITPVKNYAIHFGIPCDKTKPIDIIGYNEQLTSDDGGFLGGIITGSGFPPALDGVKRYLQQDVLTAVREKGWYGVGGFDVIIDSAGQPYLIDGNFRMTSMSAYHFLVANGMITTPMISFSGQFSGDYHEFEKAILPHAGKDSRHRTVQLIALSRHGNQWDFNGALMYADDDDLKGSIARLASAGITSPAFELYRD